jgi:hypothetical protein
MMTQIKRWILGITTVDLQWCVRMMSRLQSFLLDVVPDFKYQITRRVLFFTLYEVVLPVKLVISGALAWSLAARGRVR